jgi:hypothetical protein
MKLRGKLKQKKRKDQEVARYAKRKSARPIRLPDYEPSGLELAIAAAGLIGKMQRLP